MHARPCFLIEASILASPVGGGATERLDMGTYLWVINCRDAQSGDSKNHVTFEQHSERHSGDLSKCNPIQRTIRARYRLRSLPEITARCPSNDLRVSLAVIGRRFQFIRVYFLGAVANVPRRVRTINPNRAPFRIFHSRPLKRSLSVNSAGSGIFGSRPLIFEIADITATWNSVSSAAEVMRFVARRRYRKV